MIIALVLIPSILALTVLFLRSFRIGRATLIGTAIIHAALTIATWLLPLDTRILFGVLGLDELGRLFLTIVSLLFLVASFYGVGYLAHSSRAHASQRTENFFIVALLFFLSTMTLVTVCQHFELLWVAIEATTLASAPLIYFHRTKQSLEATWKYLMICSFGIAIALLGNFCFSISGAHSGHTSMIFGDLLAYAPFLQIQWLKAAFILLFVGYATKMGMAPLHTWLPDAHSEAPSLVSALLSGALLNCAFLGVLRAYQVAQAAGLARFLQPVFIGFGLVSMAFAAIFIIRQTDFKRMLAYSSVEHMGILLLSVGLGGAAVFGGMLHMIGHSLIKAMLFLVAGNILIAYRTKSTQAVAGLQEALPVSGALWFLGLFAITGLPPFGLFTSEFIILKTALDQNRPLVAILFLVFLAAIFIGMFSIGLKMLLGKSPEGSTPPLTKEWLWSAGPPVFLAVLILLLGPHIPPFLSVHLHKVAQLLGGVG